MVSRAAGEMKIFFIWVICLITFQARALELKLVTTARLQGDVKFEKTTLAGLSGLTFNPEKKLWVAISDDRGRFGQPRFYDLDFKVSAKSDKLSLNVVPRSVVFIHSKENKNQKNIAGKGIVFLPWGNYLIANEGDLSQKPRVAPTLLDIKQDGSIVRNFSLPDEVLPELLGPQRKGIQNNRGPEGMAASGEGKMVWAAIESPLIQEKESHPNQIRILQYEMTEAWVIKPTKSYYYPLEKASPGAVLSERGVSEIFWLQSSDLLVMERSFEVYDQHLGYAVKIFKVTVGEEGAVLKKELVVDLKSLGLKVANFEGMTFGPDLPDGRKTLLIMSNNHFQKDVATEFWLFALESEKAK